VLTRGSLATGERVPRTLLAIALTLASSLYGRAFSAQEQPNLADDLALQMVYALSDADKKGVLVMDLTTLNGKRLAFGSWLADQLSSSLANLGQPTIEMIDRSQLANEVSRQHLSPAEELYFKNEMALGKAMGANTVIVGSYGAVEHDIGVTLVAYRVSQGGANPTMLSGKIPFNEEAQRHLDVTLDSLRPSDGIYNPGYGGVTVPFCIHCPLPPMRPPDVDIPGLLRDKPQGVHVTLRFVVTPEGHVKQIAVSQPIGHGVDEQYAQAILDWEFRPAVDANRKPVPVHFFVNVAIRFNPQGSTEQQLEPPGSQDKE